jgi:hypothetical protein
MAIVVRTINPIVPMTALGRCTPGRRQAIFGFAGFAGGVIGGRFSTSKIRAQRDNRNT